MQIHQLRSKSIYFSVARQRKPGTWDSCITNQSNGYIFQKRNAHHGSHRRDLRNWV